MKVISPHIPVLKNQTCHDTVRGGGVEFASRLKEHGGNICEASHSSNVHCVIKLPKN